MFGKKKEQVRDINAHERNWNTLQHNEWDTYMKMSSLFEEIKASREVAESFPIGSVDRESELAHLTSLQHSMLCACGQYDTIRAEQRRMYNELRDEMIEWHCLNGLYSPKGNCHDALRKLAQRK